MSNKRSISINNKNYSTVSGEALKTSQRSNKEQGVKPIAQSVHSSPQKSQTLNRQYTKKPVKNITTRVNINQSTKNTHERVVRSADITKSSAVSRFQKKPILTKKAPSIKPQTKTTTTTKPKVTQTSKRTPVTSKALSPKERAISQSLATAPSSPKKTKFKITKKQKRRIILFTSILIGFLITAFLIFYFSTPLLSIHVANNQAGINATYPSRLPEGIKMTGPAEFKNGAVVIQFTAQNGDKFYLHQSKTISDSSALKQEVKKRSNNSFVTTEYKGLTIFNYENPGQENQYITVWVNGEILYSLSSKTDLGASEVRTIIDGLG